MVNFINSASSYLPSYPLLPTSLPRFQSFILVISELIANNPFLIKHYHDILLEQHEIFLSTGNTISSSPPTYADVAHYFKNDFPDIDVVQIQPSFGLVEVLKGVGNTIPVTESIATSFEKVSNFSVSLCQVSVSQAEHLLLSIIIHEAEHTACAKFFDSFDTLVVQPGVDPLCPDGNREGGWELEKRVFGGCIRVEWEVENQFRLDQIKEVYFGIGDKSYLISSNQHQFWCLEVASALKANSAIPTYQEYLISTRQTLPVEAAISLPGVSRYRLGHLSITSSVSIPPVIFHTIKDLATLGNTMRLTGPREFKEGEEYQVEEGYEGVCRRS